MRCSIFFYWPGTTDGISDNQLSGLRYAKLRKQRFSMLPGRRNRNREPRGDCTIGQSFGDQGKHSALSGGWRHAVLQDKF